MKKESTDIHELIFHIIGSLTWQNGFCSLCCLVVIVSTFLGTELFRKSLITVVRYRKMLQIFHEDIPYTKNCSHGL